MKKLQNNYTTPEQSKRLLELGVPAWTADCYYYDMFDKHIKVSYIDADKDYKWDLENEYAPKPCWSVGRLIEIYKIVGEEAGRCVSCSKRQTQVESLVQLYEENIESLDFSKLYEDEVTE